MIRTPICGKSTVCTGTESNQLDGNNAMIFLKKIDQLQEAKLDGKDAPPGSPALIPAAAHPVLYCMTALGKVVTGCFSYELAANYKELIADYVEQLRELPTLMLATCNSRKGFTWKVGTFMVGQDNTVHLFAGAHFVGSPGGLAR